MYKNIIIIFVFTLTCSLTSCDSQKEEASIINQQEQPSNKTQTTTSTDISDEEITREDLEDTGDDNWKSAVCDLWKENDCKDPGSATCQYWKPSKTHIGMTRDICVQAMNMTLIQCNTKQSFFQHNPRNCNCIEQQYRNSTHRPNTMKKEGPLFAEKCFVK